MRATENLEDHSVQTKFDTNEWTGGEMLLFGMRVLNKTNSLNILDKWEAAKGDNSFYI